MQQISVNNVVFSETNFFLCFFLKKIEKIFFKMSPYIMKKATRGL